MTRFYHFESTSTMDPPDTKIVDYIIEISNTYSQSEETSGLAVVPYRSDANSVHTCVLAASIILSEANFALALDQPLGLVFVDFDAVRSLRKRYPGIAHSKTIGLHFNFDDLCDAFVLTGFKIANIAILLSHETFDYYQTFQKKWWHMPGSRWWQK